MDVLGKLLSNKTIKNISVVTFGNMTNAFLGFVLLVVISRYLGPDKYGVFSVFFSLLMLMSKFGDLGTNQTLARYLSLYRGKNDKQHEQLVIGFIIGLTIVLSVVVLSLLGFGHELLAKLLDVSSYSNLVLLTILFASILIFYDTFNVVIQASEKFSAYVVSYSVVTGIKIIGVLLMIYVLNTGLENLIYLYLIAPLGGAIYGYRYIKKHIINPIPVNLSSKSYKLMSPFLLYMAIATLLSGIVEQLGVFVSSSMFENYDVGLYSAATKISTMVVVLTGSIGTVLVPKVSRYTDLADIVKFTKKASVLGTVGFIGILPIVIFPKAFIYITSGPEYYEAAPILSLLAIVGAINFIRGVIGTSFYALGKANYFAYVSVLLLIIELPLMYICGNKYGVVGLTYSKLISAILIFVYTYVYLRYSIRSKNIEK